LDDEQAKKAIAGLGGVRSIRVETTKPGPAAPAPRPEARPFEPKAYTVGEKEATRKAYGDALVALGAHVPGLVVLDAEVSNSTHADEFKKAYPDRFFEMFIAEQQMLGAAVGLAVLGKVAFASTFAAFLTRAYDQIRMAAVSGASIRLCGSHAGSSIGEDGPSQMGLEDLAMMRAVHGSTVFYPSDPNQTAKLVALMAERDGISYIRTTRGKTPVIYDSGQSVGVGGSKVVRRSDGDRATIAAAGITLHEAIKAHDTLARKGVSVRVLDLYSVKPIDRDGLRRAAREAGGRLVVVEDHWPEGGLGDAVLEAFAGDGEAHPKIVKLAVSFIAPPERPAGRRPPPPRRA